MDTAVPIRSLTANPHLGQLKKQAKELLAAYREGNPVAIAEVRQYEWHPDSKSFALADAQRVLARAFGFPSWARLKHFIERNAVKTEQEAAISKVKPCDYFMASLKGREYWEMICAAIRNDLPTLQERLKAFPGLARREFWYTSPLWFAVREGNLEAVELFWQTHAYKGYQGLHKLIEMADERGHHEVAAFLKEQSQEKEIDPKQSKLMGKLHNAVKEGHMITCNTMISACLSGEQPPGSGCCNTCTGLLAL